MAHGFDLDFTEIINDGNNHLQQPTNVIQMEHSRMERNQMEHNQMEHTPNVPYNNYFNISRDPSDTTTYTTGNYEESSSLMDNQLGTSAQYDDPLVGHYPEGRNPEWTFSRKLGQHYDNSAQVFGKTSIRDFGLRDNVRQGKF
ncbi:unnamed protein product [Rhizophagus irregularis]|uniref:Uncharacterized protein n=1 Tax=Rhizophagus irregularis TaxID=588596 RepID=A0A2I1E106_9GLOM|nr:hypothetical protein RhiirB3_381238 [Rhizophagus irregularis]CAB5365369.1 unnamed protein product [Rhizophagus irregularis]